MEWIDEFINELFAKYEPNLEPLYSLVGSSTLDEDHRQDIEYQIMCIEDEAQYKEVLIYLLSNQLDRINSGMNYSQTDILKKLRNEIKATKN